MKSTLLSCLLFIIIPLTLLNAQTYTILESNSKSIKIEFNFTNKFHIKESQVNGKVLKYIEGDVNSSSSSGEPWMPIQYYNLGIPFNADVQLSIIKIEQSRTEGVFLLPYPDSSNQPFDKLSYKQEIYSKNEIFPQKSADIINQAVMRYLNIAGLSIAPYQYNPVTRELLTNNKIIIQINYNNKKNNKVTVQPVVDNFTEDFVQSGVINPTQAKDFIGKAYDTDKAYNRVASDTFWYNPTKEYYKIFLKEKGLYRVSFDNLVAAGAPANGLENGKLEIINLGERIPIEIVDVNNNQIFDSGDYFNFVGFPPKPSTPYTYYNIYNNSNVYWFSYQADSLCLYSQIPGGNPSTFTSLTTSTLKTFHFEKDLWYEHMGYAPNDKRDYWAWEPLEMIDYHDIAAFWYFMVEDSLPWQMDQDKRQTTLRFNLQGLTYNNCSDSSGHSVIAQFNRNVVASKKWNGQETVTFEANFPIGNGTPGSGLPLYTDSNEVLVTVDGNVCNTPGNDFVLLNWFEYEFWKNNMAKGDNFIFMSSPNETGIKTYYLWQWQANNMKVYIPSRGKLIADPYIINDANLSVEFVDTVAERTEYFCYANNRFLTPDSIVKDNSIADLRNISQGADYIIITHKDFKSVSERLANYRMNNLPGIPNPRVKIVDVEDIYDEFSYGLLDPYSLQYFAKYAFENWQSPAPYYIVLVGDMSYDYRHIYSTNKKNFIPSVPYHAATYGQAPSDNLIATVAGNDIVPDLAIGRISCETVEQGNTLVDKIINYPADNGKNWKQNVLLMASGMSLEDELGFGFNDQSVYLENAFLKPNGIHATKIFRFPSRPEHIPFQGGGPEIRAAFNEGTVLANYYGHGGGGQWDLTFTNDDILELNNGNRLPVILSVTCYTAHFDNQDVFGELFNRIPGKGSVAFYGSAGLTWWSAGVAINYQFFKDVFNNRDYVLGKAILYSKANISPAGLNASQITLLTLLGDPALELALPKKPDLVIKSSDISFSKKNPIKGDTVAVTVRISNLGVTPTDSVTLNLYTTRIDTATKIGSIKLPPFGELDSAVYNWVPAKAGLFNIIAAVNNDNLIDEDDHSDNEASNSIAVFDFNEPNVVGPVNGFVSNQGTIKFVLVDIGNIVGRQFNYKIVVDTSMELNSANKISSEVLTQKDGIVQWNSPNLSPGEYFWKAYIFENADTNYSKVYTFSVSSALEHGYVVQNKQIQTLESSNINYNPVNQTLVLNTSLLPPRPSEKQFLDSTNYQLPADTTEATTFTTDGTYFYFADITFYKVGGPSKIYKVGTGYNGTTKGQLAGSIPNLEAPISNQMFCYSDGYLYAATLDSWSLLRIDVNTGDTIRIALQDSLLPATESLVRNQGAYVTTDGNYVYNLTPGYEGHSNQFSLRIFDPHKNWSKVEDIVFPGTSGLFGFSGFAVIMGYLYTYESYNSGYIRRYKISDRTFEEEWLLAGHYTIGYDWIHNNFIASTFYPNNAPYIPSFQRFWGTYKDALGSIITPEIGPALKWNSLKAVIDTVNSEGNYYPYILGHNVHTGIWDTIKTNVPLTATITDIDAAKYDYIKWAVNFVDSSFGVSEPLKFKSLNIDYTYPAEVSVNKDNYVFQPDTVLQGFDVNLSLKAYNLSETRGDTVRLKFFANDADSAFYETVVNIPSDSSTLIVKTIQTSNWPPATEYKVKAEAGVSTNEYFTFNNLTEKSFYVQRDSTNPQFAITFDGKEIVSGDVVSSKPEIEITLKDDSPLPLDTSFFTIMHTVNGTQIPFSFNSEDVQFNYTPYPNSEEKIIWKPTLDEGDHILSLLAKDASGNFFDTVSYQINFKVYKNTDLVNVFNYPNPFKTDTRFTFEYRGTDKPNYFNIKIYTVAGRLIRNINIPSADINFGFNSYYWDGRDQDGDEVANGVYFYKVVSQTRDVTKTTTMKLAKLK